VKKLFKKKQTVTEKNITQNLWLASEPDLVIRTSGEYRISNFLIWQINYSELLFTKKRWPEFNKKDFINAIKEYKTRKRRFGK